MIRDRSPLAARTLILAVILLGWAGAISFSLFRLQLFNYQKYRDRVRVQSNRELELIAKRGTIFDRNGEILAISVMAKSLAFSGKDQALALTTLERVAKILDLPAAQKMAVRKRLRQGERFVWVKRKLSDGEYQRLVPFTSDHETRQVLLFFDEYRRVYPQNGLAGPLLGGVGMDEQPLSGIELAAGSRIEGRGGRFQVLIDARKKVFQTKPIEPSRPGHDVFLTIDATLQYILEQELARAVTAHRAQGGSVVLLDAHDGQVLAMASAPGFFPADIGKTPAARTRHQAVSFIYDPGSTFKVVLGSAALESAACTPGQIIPCSNGRMTIRDRVITDVHPYSELSFAGVIVHSSNVGAARIGFRLGAKRYHRWITDFGFGRSTGCGLPGEERGILRPPAQWSEVSLAYLSFGYELSVTPLQMAQAFNVLASGGYRMSPRVIIDAKPASTTANERVRLLSPATVRAMTSIMTEVVAGGTGNKAGIDGLRIAGKTGTAKKVKGGRYTSDYVASFGGFFPAEQPAMTLFVVIDEPQGLYYGGDVAAPLFRSIVERIRVQWGLGPSLPDSKEVSL